MDQSCIQYLVYSRKTISFHLNRQSCKLIFFTAINTAVVYRNTTPGTHYTLHYPKLMKLMINRRDVQFSKTSKSLVKIKISRYKHYTKHNLLLRLGFGQPNINFKFTGFCCKHHTTNLFSRKHLFEIISRWHSECTQVHTEVF